MLLPFAEAIYVHYGAIAIHSRVAIHKTQNLPAVTWRVATASWYFSDIFYSSGKNNSSNFPDWTQRAVIFVTPFHLVLQRS